MRLLRRTLLAVGVPLMFTACASIAPPRPPSLELPRPPKDLRAVRKGDRVTLTWTVPATTTDRQRVRSLGATQICRGIGTALTQCGPVAGQASPPNSSAKNLSLPKAVGSYVDVLSGQLESDDPAGSATYAVEVRNGDGRSAGISNQVRVSLIRTLPPPQDFHITVTDAGLVLSWTSDVPHAVPTTPVTYAYRVYRRLEDSTQWILAGQVPAREREESFTDSSFEWEKTYVYRADTVTVIARDGAEEQVEGDDTPEVKVFAHDVFPPAVPSGLQAVFSGPGQQAFIDLVWAPVTDVDLAGYNVYRHEEGSAPVKVNTELVKAPAYRDANVSSGKHYIYSVSAVDVRGNESARSEEAGESVP